MRPLLLALALLLAGCGQTVYVTRPLPLPERPVLPQVYETELMCLSDDAYRNLVERYRLLRNYAERLEAIIRSTHETSI